MTIVIIILAIIALIAVFLFGNYNGLVGKKNQVEEAFSTMDVYLKKRYDLIPNLVETVKGYAAHESGTLEKVIQARNMAMNAGSTEDKIAAENQLTGTLKSLFALSESYPDLKANSNFESLQRQLEQIEDDIANSRKYYNGSVKQLNNKIEMFPSNIIAGMFNFKKYPYFEVDSAEERQNVKVQF